MNNECSHFKKAFEICCERGHVSPSLLMLKLKITFEGAKRLCEQCYVEYYKYCYALRKEKIDLDDK